MNYFIVRYLMKICSALNTQGFLIFLRSFLPLLCLSQSTNSAWLNFSLISAKSWLGFSLGLFRDIEIRGFRFSKFTAKCCSSLYMGIVGSLVPLYRLKWIYDLWRHYWNIISNQSIFRLNVCILTSWSTYLNHIRLITISCLHFGTIICNILL
jgi:hypothetical protein